MYTNATIHVDGTAASARCRLPPTKGGERRSCGQVSMVGSLPTSGHAVALSFEVSRKNSGSAPGVCTGGTEEMVGDLIRDLTWEWSNLFAALPRTVGNRSWGGIGGGWDLVTHREPLYECSLACLRSHACASARTHARLRYWRGYMPTLSEQTRAHIHASKRPSGLLGETTPRAGKRVARAAFLRTARPACVTHFAPHELGRER